MQVLQDRRDARRYVYQTTKRKQINVFKKLMWTILINLNEEECWMLLVIF